MPSKRVSLSIGDRVIWNNKSKLIPVIRRLRPNAKGTVEQLPTKLSERGLILVEWDYYQGTHEQVSFLNHIWVENSNLVPVPRGLPSKAERLLALEEVAKWAWRLRRAHMMDQRDRAKEQLEKLLDKFPEYEMPNGY